MKRIAAFLALLGAALLGSSLTLSPYKDERAFMQQYLTLQAGQSTEYFALRASQLTVKYLLQDFGVQALLLSVLVALLTRRGQLRINAIRSRAFAATAATVFPLLFVGGYIFDLLQGYDRGEFPRWADSMGIPLMGAPMMLIFLWLWAFGNLAFSSARYQPEQPISLAFRWRGNWWQLMNAVLWFLMAAMSGLHGQYWYALPAAAWLYFFLSIAASRNTNFSGQDKAARAPDAARIET